MGKETRRVRGGTRYLDLEARSLLNRCLSDRMPFEWTVNPYRGCAMGCRYCYATYTHEFLGFGEAEEFHKTVFVKRGGLEETARALAAVVRRGERIALGTATDPYQPGEPQEGVTRLFLTKVAQYRGAELSITTKGAGILRDTDLLLKIHERSRLQIRISLISMDAALLREIEPLAPPPEARLAMIRALTGAGLPVELTLAPILPLLTDSEKSLDELLGRVSEAGAKRFFHNVLFLRSPTREKYLSWLSRTFPEKASPYRRAYQGRAYLPDSYTRRIGERVFRLARSHGLEPAREPSRSTRPKRQLGLFEVTPGLGGPPADPPASRPDRGGASAP